MKAIIAIDPRGGIGYNGQLPWSKLDNDMLRFKTLTTGNVVVMGRTTWDSLPRKPLPNRKNIVVSSQLLELPDGVELANNINSIIDSDQVWCIGGATLLSNLWERVTEIHVTRADQIFTCDIFIDLVYLEKNFSMAQSVRFSDNNYEIWTRQ